MQGLVLVPLYMHCAYSEYHIEVLTLSTSCPKIFFLPSLYDEFLPRLQRGIWGCVFALQKQAS